MQLLQVQTQVKTRKQDYVYDLVMQELNNKGVKIVSFSSVATFHNFMFNCLNVKILLNAKNDNDYYKMINILACECKAIYNNYFSI